MSDFLGRGLVFPVVPDAGGTLRYVAEDENVAQSLRLLLSTTAGERVMRPTLGVVAPRLVFAPGSTVNREQLRTQVD